MIRFYQSKSLGKVIHITMVGVKIDGDPRKGGLWWRDMTAEELRASLRDDEPPSGLTAPTASLWWDAKGDWARAHALVDELETPEGMAVHAYLHRKEGQAWNADYWYERAGRGFHRAALEEEWEALAEGLTG